MKSSSGAGASVASGADYQARVAASILATAMCGMSTEFICPDKIVTLSFETAEKIDDIVLETNTGGVVYIQAKANISFSLSNKGELRSVFKQFKSQHCLNGRNSDIYILATGMRSSKKVIYDLRVALNVYSACESRFFFKDQSKEIREIIKEIKYIDI